MVRASLNMLIQSIGVDRYIFGHVGDRNRYRSTISHAYPKNNSLPGIVSISLDPLVKEIGNDRHFHPPTAGDNRYRHAIPQPIDRTIGVSIGYYAGCAVYARVYAVAHGRRGHYGDRRNNSNLKPLC